MTKGGRIPVIDLKEQQAQLEKIMEACREWGCFRLVNHKISPALMSEMKLVTRSLLDLPTEIKQRNAHPVHGKGYTPPNQGGPVFEGLGCYDMASSHSLNAFFDQLGVSPHQRDTIVKYSEAIHGVAMEIAQKLAEGLGLNAEDYLFKEWPCQLRMNKYNYTPDYVGSTGVILHTDPGFLTILQDDEAVGGLEAVHKDTSEFVAIDPMPGSLIVNLGDLATIWSNGRLWTVKHRVQCYEGTIRVSIACFVFGPKDVALEAPPELVDSDHPRLYKSMNFEDYRMLRISTKSPTGAIQHLRITASGK